MLDREILKLNYGVSYGSVTLSSLQNDAVPEIDLLVREAIQNSSDAAIGLEGPSYRVGFQTGTFAPIAFNAYLTDIEDHLNARYPLSTAEYIEIRDSKLSNRLGKNLLPRVGYGKRTSGGNGGSGGGGGGKVSNILFEITSQAVRGNLLTIDFSLKMLHSCKSAKV